MGTRKKRSLNIEAILGTVTTVLVAICAYFLNRLINQYDEFQKQTKLDLGKIAKQLSAFKTSSESALIEIAEIRRAIGTPHLGRIDKETKAQISQIKEKVTTIENELLQKIKPHLEKARQSHGDVVWIKENMKTQDAKILGLYKIADKLVKDQKKRKVR